MRSIDLILRSYNRRGNRRAGHLAADLLVALGHVADREFKIGQPRLGRHLDLLDPGIGPGGDDVMRDRADAEALRHQMQHRGERGRAVHLGHLAPHRRQQVKHPPVRDRGLREGHDRQCGKIVDPRRPRQGEMRRGDEPAQTDRRQRGQHRAARRLVAQHDRHIEPVAAQLARHLVRGVDRDLEAQQRMARPHRGQQPRQQGVGDRLGNAKPHHARHLALCELAEDPVALCHQQLGLLAKPPPRRAQPHAAAVALEDGDLHPVLEMVHPARDRRLRKAGGVGGRPEAAMAHDGADDLDIAKIEHGGDGETLPSPLSRAAGGGGRAASPACVSERPRGDRRGGGDGQGMHRHPVRPPRGRELGRHRQHRIHPPVLVVAIARPDPAHLIAELAQRPHQRMRRQTDQRLGAARAGLLDQPVDDQPQAGAPLVIGRQPRRDHQPRAFPHLRRGDLVGQHGRRDMLELAAMRVAQHVGVRAPDRLGRHRPGTAHDRAARQHQRVMCDGGVVLVHLDLVIMRHVPAELVDEDLLAQPQEVVERRAVAMQIGEFESDIFHACLLLDTQAEPRSGNVFTLEGCLCSDHSPRGGNREQFDGIFRPGLAAGRGQPRLHRAFRDADLGGDLLQQLAACAQPDRLELGLGQGRPRLPPGPQMQVTEQRIGAVELVLGEIAIGPEQHRIAAPAGILGPAEGDGRAPAQPGLARQPDHPGGIGQLEFRPAHRPVMGIDPPHRRILHDEAQLGVSLDPARIETVQLFFREGIPHAQRHVETRRGDLFQRVSTFRQGH
ncbi:hypothetical protein SDC9_36106 [bioreactor metagenome]|uniref:Uncharacterized protein n=1 Tax=bioreactor metagenome TaxID=1076179 RepID=A0A644VFL2_9ZZZZ